MGSLGVQHRLNSFDSFIASYNTLLFSLTENLKQLIVSAKECGITLYYALSPGLDILFSSSREIQLLKKKMDQVIVLTK